jgi:uncharacterized protein (TIGR02444 family)
VTRAAADLWTFSLAVYRHEPVQRECLTLQDQYGLDVNLVLFCAFVGAIHGAILSEQTIEEAMDAVSAWHRPVVSTLREARRALKLLINTQPPIGSDIASLRTKVKALELEAERVEQNMLEHWLNSKVGLLPRAEPRTAADGNVRTLFAMSAQNKGPPPLPQNLIAAALAIRAGGDRPD